MSIVESIAANFSNIDIKNKENIKIGWGTDTAQYTLGNNPDSTNSVDLDQRHKSVDSLELGTYNKESPLQTMMNFPRNMAMDTSINVEKTDVQPHDIRTHTQIYTYFVTTWKKVLAVLKKISENWKMKLY